VKRKIHLNKDEVFNHAALTKRESRVPETPSDTLKTKCISRRHDKPLTKITSKAIQMSIRITPLTKNNKGLISLNYHSITYCSHELPNGILNPLQLPIVGQKPFH
jgi:hypothetical protein